MHRLRNRRVWIRFGVSVGVSYVNALVNSERHGSVAMAIYLWPNPASPYGKSILIRAKYGNGIAVAEKCCCGTPSIECTEPSAARQGDWQIVVSGVTGDGCDGYSAGQQCPDVNGTYTFEGPPDEMLRTYANTQDKNICGLYDWELLNGFDSSGQRSDDYCDYLLKHGGMDNLTYYGHGFPDDTIVMSLVNSDDLLCSNYPATIDLVPV